MNMHDKPQTRSTNSGKRKIDPVGATEPRRTGRARDGRELVERKDVKLLLQRIRENDREHTVVLKVKDNMSNAINTYVMDEILKALRRNKVCQALYIQNLEGAITDRQLKDLIEVLKVRKNIWALNIGETYHVSNAGWRFFCQQLTQTHVTHLYVSEHTIDLTLKNKMRENIRNNRSKHKKHSSLRNLSVISRCTNMWWNPINHIKHMLDAKWQREHMPPESEPPRKKREVIQADELTPNMTAYWAEGYGKGGDKPWKFKCPCGETCSSYEDYRYHPTGRMYECTNCAVWSHVDHVLGSHVSDEDLEELTDVLCNKCKSSRRREKLAELKELGIQYPFAPDGSSLVPLDNTGGDCEEHEEEEEEDGDKDNDDRDDDDDTADADGGGGDCASAKSDCIYGTEEDTSESIEDERASVENEGSIDNSEGTERDTHRELTEISESPLKSTISNSMISILPSLWPKLMMDK